MDGKDLSSMVRGSTIRAACAGLLAAMVALSVAGCGGETQQGSEQTSSEATSATEGEVVFRDDFSDTSGGWSQSENDFGSTGYAEGAYRVLANPGGTQGSDTNFRNSPGFRRELVELGYVSVEADVVKASGGPSAIGLTCRGNHEDPGVAHYEGNIDTDGFWAIVKVENQQPTPLAQPENASEESGAIRDGDAVNRVRLYCVGGADGGPATLSLRANGELVAEADDPDGLPAGTVGVIAASFDPESDQPTEAFFDDFTITRQ